MSKIKDYRKKLNADIGQKLQEARKVSGFYQQQAADLLGISRYTLINYESGKTEINIDLYMKMAELYKGIDENIISNIVKKYMKDI